MRNSGIVRRAALARAAFALATAATLALPAAGDDCTTYGSGVALDTATPVAAIAAAPDEWAGKTVRVEGEVREVCPMPAAGWPSSPRGATLRSE